MSHLRQPYTAVLNICFYQYRLTIFINRKIPVHHAYLGNSSMHFFCRIYNLVKMFNSMV